MTNHECRMMPGVTVAYAVLFAIIILLISAFAVFAQTSTSGAAAGAAANNSNLNASQSGALGNSITYNSNGGEVKYGGSYELRNVPGVSPPGFSSGHPCAFAPVSFGVGIVGGGASAGGQRIDNACLLAQMGYKREAMAMIAARDPAAMAALRATGQVQGPSTLPTASASSKAPGTGYSKCTLEGGKIKIRYTSAGRSNKTAAQANCKRALGF